MEAVAMYASMEGVEASVEAVEAVETSSLFRRGVFSVEVPSGIFR